MQVPTLVLADDVTAQLLLHTPRSGICAPPRLSALLPANAPLLGCRQYVLRLSIITGDRPVLVLRIIQLEAVQEDMANEFRDLLVEKFKDSKVETFIGTFTA